MCKRIFALMIVLAFAAPTGLAFVAPKISARIPVVSEASPDAGPAWRNRILDQRERILVRQAGLQALIAPEGSKPTEIRDILVENALVQNAMRREPLALALVRINHVMAALKSQENALAIMLDTDKPEETKEYEERLSRRRETHHAWRAV